MENALRAALAAHVAQDNDEAHDLARTIAMLEATDDPWSRQIPLHVTASALVVDETTGRVLLRWHAKQQRWLQVGGHGDPGEHDPWLVALREAEEETGLTDLRPLDGGALFQVTIVDVVAAADELPHEHADLRYLLATDQPDDAPDEREGVALQWFTLGDALAVADDGLARLLRRVPGLR